MKIATLIARNLLGLLFLVMGLISIIHLSGRYRLAIDQLRVRCGVAFTFDLDCGGGVF